MITHLLISDVLFDLSLCAFQTQCTIARPVHGGGSRFSSTPSERLTADLEWGLTIHYPTTRFIVSTKHTKQTRPATPQHTSCYASSPVKRPKVVPLSSGTGPWFWWKMAKLFQCARTCAEGTHTVIWTMFFFPARLPWRTSIKTELVLPL